MAASNLADAAMTGRTQARLADTRVQPEVAHEFSRMAEPVDVADRRHEAGCDRQLDPGDGHQPLHRAVVECSLGDLPIEDGEIPPSRSSSRRCRSIASRSSSGKSWRPSHARPR